MDIKIPFQFKIFKQLKTIILFLHVPGLPCLIQAHLFSLIQPDGNQNLQSFTATSPFSMKPQIKNSDKTIYNSQDMETM